MAMRETAASGRPLEGALPREEALALIIALAAHAGLIAALTLAPPGKQVPPLPERMTINISDIIAERAVSPQPDAQTAPDVAPDLGEPEPVPEPMPEPKPEPKSQPPKPEPPKPLPPKPVLKPTPRPVPPPPRVLTQPQPAVPKPAVKTLAAKAPPAKTPPAKTSDERPRRRPDVPSGASRIGDDFLKGVSSSPNPGTARTPPAAVIGPEVVASLVSAIARQIKPNWTAPQGVDSDKLVTVLSWTLNPDGSLAGKPTVVMQSGDNDANRAQKQRHAEQAIRAVQLAAPFELPAEYYSKWKRVGAFRFDRKLSQ